MSAPSKIALLFSFAAVACGAADDESPAGPGGGGGSAGAGGAPTTSGSGGSVQSVGVGSGGGPELTAEVYAHSQTTLYRLDPDDKSITSVGDFDCVLGGGNNLFGQGMADIALDAGGQMYGVGAVVEAAPGVSAPQGLVRIDKTSGACTVVAEVGEQVITGLTFLPAGAMGPAEALVGIIRAGLTQTSYVSFDVVTGQMSEVGGFGATWFATSPDLVSIEGDSTYATAYPNFSPEHLLEIDPESGLVTDDRGNLDLNGVTGMGYWAGTVYLFMHSGQLFEVAPQTAVPTEIPIPDLPAGLQWWGAGVTTSAPTQPPR